MPGTAAITESVVSSKIKGGVAVEVVPASSIGISGGLVRKFIIGGAIVVALLVALVCYVISRSRFFGKGELPEDLQLSTVKATGSTVIDDKGLTVKQPEEEEPVDVESPKAAQGTPAKYIQESPERDGMGFRRIAPTPMGRRPGTPPKNRPLLRPRTAAISERDSGRPVTPTRSIVSASPHAQHVVALTAEILMVSDELINAMDNGQPLDALKSRRRCVRLFRLVCVCGVGRTDVDVHRLTMHNDCIATVQPLA